MYWLTRFTRAAQNVQINYAAGYALPNQLTPDWPGGTQAVFFGGTIIPTSNNAGGFAYVATRGGATGASRPSFNQSAGGTTADGAIVWANLGVTAIPATFPNGLTTALPPDLTQACIELVGLRVREKGHIGQLSVGMGGEQTIQYVRTSMPASVEELLQTYRQVAPVMN
ncbi:MAG TPA: hypothetical protein VKS22_13255 [Candidatus Binataceae bacterium]|nr:hypothetical protein [Candidatus Binataceae bacterium]